MSDADDRMERADRIREMRRSREQPEEEEEEDDVGGASGTDESSANESSANEDDSGADGNAASEDAEAEGTPSPGREDASDPASAATTPAGAATTDSGESGDGAVPAADVAGAIGGSAGSGTGVAPLGGESGFSLSDAGDSDYAGDADDGATSARGADRAGATAAADESSVRVLEFVVGGQTYCTDIERVEEIVKRETVTRVPNTHDAVAGVVDLRGQITTILDSKQLLDVGEPGRESLLVIFSPDAFEEHGTVGWVVDEVRQVVPVTESQVRTSPGDADHVRGVVDRADAGDLTVWIRPGVAMSRAIDGDGVDAGPTE